MPDVITPELDLVKPGINESEDSWGIKWNDNADKIDANALSTRTTIEALTARITALETEAAKASFVGEIRIWSGSIAQIDTLPGGVWKLCNGQPGTPNLADRFILGAHAGRLPNNVGGQFSYQGGTHNAGAHGHNVQYTAITEAQLPPHNHYVNDPGHAHGTQTYKTAGGAIYFGGVGGNMGESSGTYASATGIWLSNTGSGQGHTHGLDAVGDHAHLVDINSTPPFYTLCYIIRTA